MDKKVLYDLSYGLYAVTVNDGKKPTGCIVNTVFQITSDGPIIALSLNHDNYTHKIVSETKKFVINSLCEKTPKDLITKLGYFSGKDTDKFEGLSYDIVDGLPVFTNTACSYMVCEVIDVFKTSTHDVFFARVVAGEKGNGEKPMTYEYYRTVHKGVSPKNAPSYQKEESDELAYVCDVCNHKYVGDITKEGSDYKCPICSMDISHFKKV